MGGLWPTPETHSPKEATENDVDKIIELCRNFHRASPYASIPFEGVDEVVRTIIRAGVVFFTDSGFIAGVLNPLLFNPSQLVAQEIAWWSEDGHGADLMDAFEVWAREQGATILQFSALNNKDFQSMDKKYHEYGFKPTEVNYMRAL